MRRLWIIVLLWATMSAAHAVADCSGRFPNPITDICWSCMFPLKLAGQNVITMAQEDIVTLQGQAPMCYCTNPIRAGLTTNGFIKG